MLVAPKPMKLPRLALALGSILLTSATLQAGDDATPSAQMNDYLQGQKITHTVETTGGDAKDGTAEALTVKIYGVTADAQQDAICTTLAATAKKSRVKEATVLFFTQPPSGSVQAAGFQASRLPSGNGEVDFARDAPPSGYRLQRTVKL